MAEQLPLQGTFLKYPHARGAPLSNVHAWLAGKRHDDGAEGLWRVHDKVRSLLIVSLVLFFIQSISCMTCKTTLAVIREEENG